jgi:hypothetical protein
MRLNRRLVGFVLAAAVLSSAASAGAAITYTVDQTIGVGSLTGTIQTDGAIGTLGASDITAWNLELNGDGASINLTNGNSSVFDPGADLTASAKNLFFNFDGSDGGYFLFEQSFGSGTHYACEATANQNVCFQGATVTPVSIFDSTAQNVPRAGNQVIGTAVPEPATWAIMLVGFGGLGAAIRSRRRVAATIA